MKNSSHLEKPGCCLHRLLEGEAYCPPAICPPSLQRTGVKRSSCGVTACGGLGQGSWSHSGYLPSFPLRLSKFRYPKQRVEMGSLSPSSARVVQNIGDCKG